MVELLGCKHRFHEKCARQQCQRTGVRMVADLKCPTCYTLRLACNGDERPTGDADESRQYDYTLLMSKLNAEYSEYRAGFTWTTQPWQKTEDMIRIEWMTEHYERIKEEFEREQRSASAESAASPTKIRKELLYSPVTPTTTATSQGSRSDKRPRRSPRQSPLSPVTPGPGSPAASLPEEMPPPPEKMPLDPLDPLDHLDSLDPLDPLDPLAHLDLRCSFRLKGRGLHQNMQKTMRTQTHAMPQCNRCITVHGSEMAQAMIEGKKPIEVRKTRLKSGWYNLHVGKKPLNARCQTAMNETFPDAQRYAGQFSCIIGQICIGRAMKTDTLQHPWALREFGQWCLEIVGSVSFQEPMTDVRGGQSVWYVKDTTLKAVTEAAATGEHRTFPDAFPGQEDQRLKSQQRVHTPWAKKRCRKQRSDAGKIRSRAGITIVQARVNRRLKPTDPLDKRARGRKRKRKPQSLPANAPVQEDTKVPKAASRGVEHATIGQRLLVGRTVARLRHLMGMRLLHKPTEFTDGDELAPRGGLFAKLKGEHVFILGVFPLRGVQQADIAPLHKMARTHAMPRFGRRDTNTGLVESNIPSKDLGVLVQAYMRSKQYPGNRKQNSGLRIGVRC